MALSGLDIYKLLPKTNCRDCGFVTCLAFAMQLAKKAVAVDKCPHISAAAKNTLEASAQPPIKLVSIGQGERKLQIGNENVLFRHEEKFHRPCGVGFIIDDSLSDAQIKERLKKINSFAFERVGQQLNTDLVAVRQNKDGARFLQVAREVASGTELSLILMSQDTAALKQVLALVKDRRPLLYRITRDNFEDLAGLAKEFGLPAVVQAEDLAGVENLTTQAASRGLSELIIEVSSKTAAEKIWDLTQGRRQALRKNNRLLGYPFIAVTKKDDPYEELLEAAGYIAKYAGIVLLKNAEPCQALSLLTLRQNIYSDPQKPLQIEPKLYPVGAVSDKSPVLITTNFSLSYYTVLGEVEASKLPAYILSVDTEGMSVLTAWAAEKFDPEKISSAVDKAAVKDAVSHNRLVIPGYVAVMSGELEEKSGWKIVVGPKEAAGIPAFLKNL